MGCRLYWTEGLRVGDVEVCGSHYHYLLRVRRFSIGDEVVLYDGEGNEAPARIQSVHGSTLTLRVDHVRSVPRCGPPISVALAVIKGDRMDSCIQKLCELGVERIIPMITARTIVRLDARRGQSRLARWTAIATGAVSQSQGAHVPDIDAVMSFQEALQSVPHDSHRLLCWAGQRQCTIGVPARTETPITVAIGPEGGFEPSELDTATDMGFAPVGLGPQILRADTAAVVAVAMLQWQLTHHSRPNI